MIEIGKAYLFHTHLGIWLGVISAVEPDEIRIDTCSWISEQGRMGNNVRDGFWSGDSEREYVGDGVIVPRNCIKVPWRHKVPTEDK